MVDSRDVAEQISEVDANDRFRRIAAIYIGVVAMLLSIATLTVTRMPYSNGTRTQLN